MNDILDKTHSCNVYADRYGGRHCEALRLQHFEQVYEAQSDVDNDVGVTVVEHLNKLDGEPD